MKAIFKKELRSLLLSPKGYVFVSINIFFTGLFSFIYNFYSQSTRIEYVVSLLTLITALSLPIITTELFIKERKKGTDALLLSLPVSSRDIVLGKYLAALVAVTPIAFFLILFTVIFAILSTVNFATAIVSIVGYILFFATVLAILIFIDSVCKNKIISISISYVTVIVAFVMGIIPDPTENAFLKAIVSAVKSLALFERFDDLVTGFLNLQTLLYYVCAIALFLALTLFFYKKKRKEPYALPSKSVLSVALVIIFLAINVSPAFLPSSLIKYDITDNKMYSISERSKQYLGELEEDVTVYVVNADGTNAQAEYILELMSERTDKLTVTYATQDSLTNELLSLGWDGSSALPAYSLLVRSDKRASFLSASNMYFYYNANFGTLSATDYNSYGNMLLQYYYSTNDVNYYNMLMSLMNESLILYQLEGATLNAIEYVTLDIIPTTYYITGLGGDEDSALLISTLVQSGFKALSLEGLDALPADASCIIINAPTRDLTDKERQMIVDFREASGGIIMLLSEESLGQKNLTSLLSAYGVSVDEGTVALPAPAELGEGEEFNELLITPHINETHDSVYSIAGATLSLVNTNNITVSDDRGLVIVSRILTTDGSAYIKGVEGSEGEKTLAVAVERVSQSDSIKPHTAVIATGADSFNNDNITLDNFNFVISAIDWCSESYSPTIGDVSPILLTQAPLIVSMGTGIAICIIISFIIPIALIATGITVSKKRKARKPVTIEE